VLQERLEFSDKELIMKKGLLKTFSHKIELLENNLKAFTESNTAVGGEKIREALNSMIKENDRLKRGTKIQISKYSQLLHNKEMLETKLLKLSKSHKVRLNQLDVLGDNPKKIGMNFLDLEEKIPVSLDYRNTDIKPEHHKILNEMRQNALSQVNQLRDLDYKTLRDYPEIREQILDGVKFLLIEYNSYNILAEKLNLFTQYVYDNFLLDDIDRILNTLRENVYEFYSCKQVNLWFKEKFSG
jgi:hypothetical protein